MTIDLPRFISHQFCIKIMPLLFRAHISLSFGYDGSKNCPIPMVVVEKIMVCNDCFSICQKFQINAENEE